MTDLFQIITLGVPAVGKSTLVKKIAGSDSILYGTISEVIYEMVYTYEDDLVSVHIIDKKGFDKSCIMNDDLNQKTGFLIVYAVDNKDSFLILENVIVELFSKRGFFIPVVLCGNKMNVKNRSITYEQGKILADRFSIPFFETDGLSNTNVDEAIQALVKKYLEFDPVLEMTKLQNDLNNLPKIIKKQNKNMNAEEKISYSMQKQIIKLITEITQLRRLKQNTFYNNELSKYQQSLSRLFEINQRISIFDQDYIEINNFSQNLIDYINSCHFEAKKLEGRNLFLKEEYSKIHPNIKESESSSIFQKSNEEMKQNQEEENIEEESEYEEDREEFINVFSKFHQSNLSLTYTLLDIDESDLNELELDQTQMITFRFNDQKQIEIPQFRSSIISSKVQLSLKSNERIQVFNFLKQFTDSEIDIAIQVLSNKKVYLSKEVSLTLLKLGREIGNEEMISVSEIYNLHHHIFKKRKNQNVHISKNHKSEI